MHAEFTFSLATLFGFLLALARVAGVLVLVPLPGFSAGTDASRIVLALALTFALFPAWPAPPPAADGRTLAVGPLIGSIVLETSFGMTIGLAVAFLLEGVQLAAQTLGLQAGYSYASTVDPTTQADSTTLQVMAQLLAGLLFFALGFDRQVLRALAESFTSSPPLLLGDGHALGTAVESMAGLGAAIFTTGLRLAIPVLALLVMLDIAFAVLGRLHPQLQLLSLSFAVKMLVSLGFLAAVLGVYPGVFERSGAETFSILQRILKR
jgi:flagellar biosynthetic protein FliR